MNKFAIFLCLFLGCLALTQAQMFGHYGYGHRRPIRYCYDYRGRPVAPGQQFSIDGCNQCVCGNNGQGGGCTLMLCPPSDGHKRRRGSRW